MCRVRRRCLADCSSEINASRKQHQNKGIHIPAKAPAVVNINALGGAWIQLLHFEMAEKLQHLAHGWV